MKGLLRAAAAVPHLYLGNVAKNTEAHLSCLRDAAAQHCGLVVFPELSLTGYTCGDLFFQRPLLDAAERALTELANGCPEGVTAVVGAPLSCRGRLYNCAVVLTHGQVLGAVAKTFLPNNGEFYEKRWFHSAADLNDNDACTVLNGTLPLRSVPTVFESTNGVRFGVEICEDLWAPLSPGTMLALAGAEVIVNLSASNELIAKREYRRELVGQQSARTLCGYVYVSAGSGESSSDLVFSGHSLIACCGSLLRESDGYLTDDYLMTADIDLERIRADRMKQQSFGDSAAVYGLPAVTCAVPVPLTLQEDVPTTLRVSKHPFIPADKESRDLRCGQIFDMQATALARRLAITGGKLVVGISGGLDSTLALLAACRAMDLLGLPRTNILGITMPCFGTTDRTYRNALTLMETLGVEQR